MSGLNINIEAITENASRLGMRIQETFSEHTRDFAVRGSSALFLDAPEDKLREIKKQLDVGTDREKLDALKRLIALISKGRNVSEYFAQVVKNVASPNLEVRKLVYIYLLRYAEQEPDLALLSINTFQKDLNDPNPLIRAMALRVLSGIKVPMIGSIVVLAIKKCAADPSPYVRKAAAFAIPKCYSLDSSHLPELIGIITTLLRDQSPLSIGNTAVAFEAVCPTRLDLLHSHYRRLCRTLSDVDEWGQVNLIGLLVRYVRTMMAKPADSSEDVDPDLQLLMDSAEPLFMSRNPAVVLSVATVFYYVAPSSQIPKIVAPLLRIMETTREVERVVLAYILSISHAHAGLFASHHTRFMVHTDDATAVKTMKMQLLLKITNNDNHQAILREFIDYAEDVDDRVAGDAIKAIGQIALSTPTASQQCLIALTGFIQSKYDGIVSNAVLVLKSLVQSQALSASASQSPLSLVSKLAQRIEEIHHPQAKACVIWLVGQYAPDSSSSVPGAPSNMASWAPDVLRRVTKSFLTEAPPVKLQIITLAAKLVVLDPVHSTLTLLARYALSLAQYDVDYDVRDRARMLSGLLRGVAPAVVEDEAEAEIAGVVLRREQVQLVLFEGKLAARPEDMSKAPTSHNQRALLGSLSVVTGRDMHGDRILPDWLEQGAEPSLRNSPDDAPKRAVPTSFGSSTPRSIVSHATPVVLTPGGGSSAPNSAKGTFTDLDKFYDDDEEEEEEEDDEEEEEEEDGSEDGSEPDSSSGSDGGGSHPEHERDGHA